MYVYIYIYIHMSVYIYIYVVEGAKNDDEHSPRDPELEPFVVRI